MVVPVFNFPVQANDAGDREYLTRNAQFGDGYEQVSGEGINSSRDTWSITYSGKIDDVRLVREFLDERKGRLSFLWRNPFGELSMYRASKYNIVPYSRDVLRLTTTFTQSFGV